MSSDNKKCIIKPKQVNPKKCIIYKKNENDFMQLKSNSVKKTTDRLITPKSDKKPRNFEISNNDNVLKTPVSKKEILWVPKTSNFYSKYVKNISLDSEGSLKSVPTCRSKSKNVMDMCKNNCYQKPISTTTRKINTYSGFLKKKELDTEIYNYKDDNILDSLISFQLNWNVGNLVTPSIQEEILNLENIGEKLIDLPKNMRGFVDDKDFSYCLNIYENNQEYYYNVYIEKKDINSIIDDLEKLENWFFKIIEKCKTDKDTGNEKYKLENKHTIYCKEVFKSYIKPCNPNYNISQYKTDPILNKIL
jgi:hypothetical protein